MRNSAWANGPTVVTDMPAADWGARPRYTSVDFITLLWRERFLMAAVFAVLFGLGLAFAMTLPTLYKANSSLLVKLGQEYVYQPRAGDAGRGAVLDNDQVIQAEIEILSSAQLKQQVIQSIGMKRLFPELAAQYAKATPAERPIVEGAAVKAIADELSIGTAPETPVIRLSYGHEDPLMAAEVLNRLTEAYMRYRKQVLLDVLPPLLAEQRRSFESRLGKADEAYEAFLQAHRIGDFEAEKTALNALHSALTDEAYRVDARLEEVQGRLGAVSADFARVQPEVGLQRDVNTTSADKLLALKLEREELLGRYTAEARPVQEVDAKIAQLERLIAGGGAAGEGARRFGINPVHQTLQTEAIQLAAEAASLRQRRSALTGQIEEVTNRRFSMTELEPRFQALSREKDALDLNLRSFVQREQESEAAQSIADKANDNIRVVARAITPTEGSSLKLPVAVAAFLFAGFTALSLGLGRIFLRRGFATPTSAARTLDLPILATAPLKGAA
jgi:uncharacterized protein involved in exopolysaccharide biosynthesis